MGSFLFFTAWSRSGISRLLSFLTEIKEGVTGLDEGLVLDFPEDGQGRAELVNGSGHLSAALAERVPVDEGVLPDLLEDGIGVLFHSFDLDFSHVDENNI